MSDDKPGHFEKRVIAPDAGDGIVLFGGWCEADDHGERGFRMIIEFPSGPPDIPISAVWKQEPVRIAMKTVK